MKIEEIRTGRTVDVHEKLAAVIIRRGRHRYVTARLVAQDDISATDTSANPSFPEADISPRTGKPKRHYRRRDMRAED